MRRASALELAAAQLAGGRPSDPSDDSVAGKARCKCRMCGGEYQDDRTLGGDILSVIVWAAARARGAERERTKLAARLKLSGLL